MFVRKATVQELGSVKTANEVSIAALGTLESDNESDAHAVVTAIGVLEAINADLEAQMNPPSTEGE